MHPYKCIIGILQFYNNVKTMYVYPYMFFGKTKNEERTLFDMNAAYEKRLGAHLRALREKAGLTQEQVAARLQVAGCDITRSAYAKIEVAQRHVYPDEIVLLKTILNVSYEEFFV